MTLSGDDQNACKLAQLGTVGITVIWSWFRYGLFRFPLFNNHSHTFEGLHHARRAALTLLKAVTLYAYDCSLMLNFCI